MDELQRRLARRLRGPARHARELQDLRRSLRSGYALQRCWMCRELPDGANGVWRDLLRHEQLPGSLWRMRYGVPCSTERSAAVRDGSLLIGVPVGLGQLRHERQQWLRNSDGRERDALRSLQQSVRWRPQRASCVQRGGVRARVQPWLGELRRKSNQRLRDVAHEQQQLRGVRSKLQPSADLRGHNGAGEVRRTHARARLPRAQCVLREGAMRRCVLRRAHRPCALRLVQHVVHPLRRTRGCVSRRALRGVPDGVDALPVDRAVLSRRHRSVLGHLRRADDLVIPAAFTTALSCGALAIRHGARESMRPSATPARDSSRERSNRYSLRASSTWTSSRRPGPRSGSFIAG
jgi:hypothetical protein